MADDSLPAVGRLRSVVFDAVDPPKLAAFWCAMLGMELDHERSIPPEWYETEIGPSGVLFAFQPVPADGAPKPRVRLDVEVQELDGPTARAEALGARLLDVVHFKPNEEHRVFADPEGNEFNLVLPFPDDPSGSD